MDTHEHDALALARRLLDHPAEEHETLIAQHCNGNAALAQRVRRLLARLEEVSDDGTSMAEDDSDDHTERLIGTRLGPFRVIERIGRGGMGVVYRGEREGADFRQEVALKLIRRGFDFDDVQARFLRERRILARLDHPHLARFIDGGMAADGRPWFALEFVHGERITRWCDSRRMDIPARVRLFLDVCAAVRYAHSQLVLHRDLKPDNILVDAQGTVRLLDFGIARLLGDDEQGLTATADGRSYAMTPEYAAPEQFAGQAVGIGVDIYALGAVLYTLIAGVPPFALERGDLFAAAQKVREQSPQPLAAAIARTEGDETPEQTQTRRLAARATQAAAYRRTVRGDLSRILDKALAREPERRYASADALADDLKRWLAGSPVQATGNTLSYRLGKFVHRNLVAVGIAAVLALGLAVTSIVAVHMALAERQQRRLAHAELERANAVRDYVMLMLRNAGEQQQGTTLTGREVLQHGAESVKARFSDSPETGASTLLMLAELFTQIGDAEGAAPLLQQVVDWPGAQAQPDTLARARYQLAQIENVRGNTGRARELLDQAQAYWHGEPDTSAAILNESRILQAQLLRGEGKLPEATDILEAAIAQRRERLGLIDRELAAMLTSLTHALNENGQHQRAYDSSDEALALFQSLGLERTANGLGALNNRAAAAVFLSRHDEAIADFQQVVEVHRELFGPNSQLAVVEINLSRMLMLAGRHAETVPLLEEALAIILAERGELSANSVIAMATLAEALSGAERIEDALPLIERALAISTEHHKSHSNMVHAAVLRSRAAVRVNARDRAGAIADLTEAEAIFSALGAAGEVPAANLRQARQKLMEEQDD